jgi:hypothetical protein
MYASHGPPPRADEGLEYLAFVERYAPDPVTADIARRTRIDGRSSDAASTWRTPAALRELHETMHRRRVRRLEQLGFPTTAAEEISEMHTPNFM